MSRRSATLALVLPFFALVPPARPAPSPAPAPAAQTSGPVCHGSYTITDDSDCPDYTVIVDTSCEPLSGCNGCRISWSARVVQISTGQTLSTSSGMATNVCDAGGVAHVFRSPCGEGLWKELVLTCGDCH